MRPAVEHACCLYGLRKLSCPGRGQDSGLHTEPAGHGHTGSLEGQRGQSPDQWGPSSSFWCNLDCWAVGIIQLKRVSLIAVDQGEIPTSLAKPNVYLVASVASDQSSLASFRKGLTGAPEWSLQEGWSVGLAWRMEGWSEGL